MGEGNATVSEPLRGLKIVAVLLALAVGVGGTTALAAASFPDPVGDVEGGAGPDIASISVSHTRSTVTFRLRFREAPPLGLNAREGWVDMLLIGIDVPPRGLKRTPNGWMGLDYYAGLHGTDKTAIVVKASPTNSSQPRKVVARPKVTISGRHAHRLSPSSRARQPVLGRVRHRCRTRDLQSSERRRER